MAFVIRHTPVAALGRLALAAGRVRGQQAQAARDLQFVSAADAAADRAASIGLAAQSRDQAFALQQAAAERISSRRPVTDDSITQRQSLNKIISDAKKAGIYSPTQIKQMGIFATLGDEGSIRMILRQPPRPPAKTAFQKKLAQQTEALDISTRNTLAPLQQGLVDINQQISERYQGAEIQRFVEERPEIIPDEDKERFVGLFARRKELEAQIEGIRQESNQVQERLSFGFTIPAQEALRIKREDVKRKRRLDAVERRETAVQKRLIRKINILKPKLKLRRDTDPVQEQIRVNRVQSKINAIETLIEKSEGRVQNAFGGTMRIPQPTRSEKQSMMDALIAEASGDLAAALRLAKERGLIDAD